MELVVLVDENDREIGTEEKLKAHREKKLHRAFSIFIFDSKGRLLLQKRADSKYHCGGLWTNTCCSHPRPGESVMEAARRRLREEMGFECDLEILFPFIYKADFENGLTEYEYDYVLIGRYEGKIDPNPEEADGWAWFTPEEVKKEMERSPEKFTPWFRIAFPRVIEELRNKGWFRNR
ncbi:MAG: isopentenyl-diphosphate Delta-isomerase [Candidatus Micrarchaeota archaeon]|nr:isopentenyl-diphosphate Delta-isomerase [Candidatus Micrarchaeota archaeon]